jgi:hypothetical protein
MDFTIDFQPRQIVCLEHGYTQLYAEVIQVLESRQRCWVRPLVLVMASENHLANDGLSSVDLRASADLLWPVTLFRPALDTEIAAHLAILASEPRSDRDLTALKQLNQFILQVWQATAILN